MGTEYTDDLTKLRDAFTRIGKSEGQGFVKILSESKHEMNRKSSVEIIDKVIDAYRKPLKSWTKEMEKGLVQMYKDSGMLRGGQYLPENLKRAASEEVKFLKESNIHPAIKVAQERIKEMGGTIDRLKKDNLNLSEKLSNVNDKFNKVSSKLTNLVGNLIHKEGMSKDKIEQYQVKAPVLNNSLTQQKNVGKSK